MESEANVTNRKKVGRRPVHQDAAARQRSWRRTFSRRVDLLLLEEGAMYVSALEFVYPGRSLHSMIDAILTERLRRKDFSVPELAQIGNNRKSVV